MTGIVEEYLALAREADADLLAMQVGDFYEFFDDHARTVADELDLAVSEKSSHGSSYPMAGVPVDDLTPYLTQLVERGYRVAVADQRDTGDGHDREVARVVTPGTMIEGAGAAARHLAVVTADDDGAYGLAAVDVTTGEFRVAAVDARDDLVAELYRLDPVELLPGPGVRESAEGEGEGEDGGDDAGGPVIATVRDRTGAEVTAFDAGAFAPGAAAHAVRDHFGEGAPASVGLDPEGAAIRAAGAAVAYVAETGTGVLGSLSRLQPYRVDDHVALDATTQRNLELAETMRGDAEGSLLAVVDHTVTGAGGRRLREWLQRPRRSRSELERRLDAVEALANAPLGREAIREALGETYDLARLASRAVSGSADARDLLRVRDSLARLPDLVETATETPGLAASPVADALARPDADRAGALRAEIDDALVDDPPSSVSGGGLFARGYDDELDDLVARHEDALDWVDGLEPREKRRLGITHLTVDRNTTDGYYLQVGNSETDAVPDDYREIKTLKNSKRYTTDELDEREREILRAEEERGDHERRLFEALRDRVADAADCLQDVGRAFAELDALASLAVHAVENDWTRPTLTDGDVLDVEAGRHPVVEQTTEFVPNGASFDADRQFLVVTGPNMSGKSTYMRQLALITLLAQVGSFVPARDATVGLVDGIYTRVGALDELAQGRSTFMVEMQELSKILHAATGDSLVVLDEVGRGTATYDGISIAWAATEYLVNEVGAKTLFATHYHELTGLADRLPGVHNVHATVDERGGDVTFLRTVEEGPADRSYGVHVADLAGVPAPVVERSRNVLERLREEKAVDVRGSASGTRQVVFDLGSGQFSSEASAVDDGAGDAGRDAGSGLDADEAEVVAELRDVDVNDVAPLELAERVAGWQDRIDGS